MAATLLSLVAVPLPAGLGLFTVILLVHNTFGAIQDVAIDSLAVNTLSEDERGLANGLMFAGASVGQAVGGSGVLFLIGITGFQFTFVAVAAAILAVTGFIVLPMKEAVAESLGAAADSAGTAWRKAGAEMKSFAVQSFRSFIGTRGAFSGVFFALLPAGAMSLGLALQSNLAVEVGHERRPGGRAQPVDLDHLRRLHGAGRLAVGQMGAPPHAVRLPGRDEPAGALPDVGAAAARLRDAARARRCRMLPALITALWISSLAYAVFQGLMYGTRSAIMMDITNPAVAATQFTAYMAMMNLAIAIAASWQGAAVEAWGYPVTLLVDAITGLLCLLLLPMLKRQTEAFSDALAEGRARKSSLVLGVCCLAWLPYWANHELLGKGQPIMGTFFTLVFIASALFLLAGPRGAGAGRGRVAPRRPVGSAAAAADVRPLLGRQARRRPGPARRRRRAPVCGAARRRHRAGRDGLSRLAHGERAAAGGVRKSAR